MRPLDRLGSIKVKLGVVVVATVFGTVLVLVALHRLGLSLPVRTLLAAVLSLAMVQFLARGMTSPLREMAAAASAMARGGYGRRVRASSRDEGEEGGRGGGAPAGGGGGGGGGGQRGGPAAAAGGPGAPPVRPGTGPPRPPR